MFLTAFLRWRRRRTPEEQVFYAREHSRATLGWVGLGWVYTRGFMSFLFYLWVFREEWCSLSILDLFFVFYDDYVFWLRYRREQW
jgi:hypothetical protein